MSSANLPAEKVLVACNEYLEARLGRIQLARISMIEKAEAREAKRWLFKPKTREQLIEEFKSDIWNDYNMLAMSGSILSAKIEHLAVLAKAAGNGVVSVSACDADTIESQLLRAINA